MTAAELERFCFGCNSLKDEPIGEEGVCKKCEQEQRWYEDPASIRHKLVKEIQHKVKTLGNGKGWLVNDELVRRES
jgi:hypothetical protein